MNTLQRLVLGAITHYKSKGGGREVFRVECNFEPSCSEYARQAVTQYGVFRGLNMTWQRIKRCSGHDCISREYDPLLLPDSNHV